MANKTYVALLIVGAAAAISGIRMRFSGSPSLHDIGTVIGWAGIVILLVARIVFGRRRSASSTKNRP